MDPTLMLCIRERAYHIWAANGGEAEQNWLRAETEILKNSAAQPPEPRASEKAACCFQPESEENGFGGARHSIGNGARCGEFAAITRNGFCESVAHPILLARQSR